MIRPKPNSKSAPREADNGMFGLQKQQGGAAGPRITGESPAPPRISGQESPRISGPAPPPWPSGRRAGLQAQRRARERRIRPESQTPAGPVGFRALARPLRLKLRGALRAGRESLSYVQSPNAGWPPRSAGALCARRELSRTRPKPKALPQTPAHSPLPRRVPRPREARVGWAPAPAANAAFA